MKYKYFYIIPANKEDAKRLAYILKSQTFYPNANSSPALPTFTTSPPMDLTFDYRVFFNLVGIDIDGKAIVHTREEWTTIEFGTKAVPTADWTSLYGLGNAPTIEGIDEHWFRTNLQGAPTYTNLDVFLSWDYSNFNNNK